MSQALNPFNLLKKYQRDWIYDQSRFKIWLKSRQIGGSFASACELIDECIRVPNTMWVVLSAKEDLAKEYLKNAQRASNVILASYQLAGSQVTLVNATASELTYSNGSRVVAMPANPRTARSYSANVLLDEFAHHENADEIWGAVYPMITNEMRFKLKMRIVSTANGQLNRFFQIFNSANDFSKHSTTIHQAIEQGFPADVVKLKANLGHDAHADLIWRQEFECEFLQEVDAVSIIKPHSIDNLFANPPMEWKKNQSCAFIDHAAGVAETAIAIVNGNRLIFLDGWVEDNTMVSAGRLLTILRKYNIKPQFSWGDDSGLGHPIHDRMMEQGWDINRVNNQSPSAIQAYDNMGAAQWYNLADLIERREVILLDDPTLKSQLTVRRVKFNSNGKLAVESKKDMASRGVASPDRADAVCGAFFFNRFVTGESQREVGFNEFFDQSGGEHLPSGLEAGIY